ncbi:NAD(P)H oxidoreductase RTN4IP1, mitochondrial-like [Glandiceps talaboti]
MVIIDTAEHMKGTNGLHLFHFPTSNCSQKVRICMEEKGLPWRSHVINLGKGEHTTKEFTQINPKNLVPVLIHDGVTIIESNDILEYLDTTFPDPCLQPRGEEEAMAKWLTLSSDIQRPLKYLTFNFMFGRMAVASRESLHRLSQNIESRDLYEFHLSFKEGHPMELLQEKIEVIHCAFEELENCLSQNDWLVGDSFSIADISWIVHVHRFKKMKFPLTKYQNVEDWYERVRAKRSFQHGMLDFESMGENIYFQMKTTIDNFLGHGVQAIEWSVQPSWTKPLLMLVLLLMSYIFVTNGINLFLISVSRPILLTLLAMALLMTFRTSYHNAHSMARYIYNSAIKSMKAVIITDYGGKEVMKINLKQPQPRVVAPDDILIKVKAASVNPIDLRVRGGYGRVFLKYLRKKAKVISKESDEFPIIPGKDCSGVVTAVGSGVTKFKVGDEVWTTFPVIAIHGSMAEFVLSKETHVARKPANISHSEAASIPYVAMTTWKALVDIAKLGPDSTQGKRVLIHAGTGGIGSFAIQLIKAWGGHVTTTCGTAGIPMVTDLGADEIVDYKKENFETKLSDKPKFDVVYDTLGPKVQPGSLNLLARGGTLATLISPVMMYTDQSGFVVGGIRALSALATIAIPQSLFHGRTFCWAFCAPNGSALETITQLVEQGKIKPVVEKTFQMQDADLAFNHVAEGHSRGKTVVVIDE